MYGRRAALNIATLLRPHRSPRVTPPSSPTIALARRHPFEGARLITGGDAAPIEDSAFVVQDHVFCGRRGEVQAPEGACVDLTGKTVMPGIIEAHAHWRSIERSGSPSADVTSRASSFCRISSVSRTTAWSRR